LARGLFDVGTLTQIHAKMRRLLHQQGGVIRAIYYCPHNASHACDCRKPKPALLTQCAADYQFDLSTTPMIGDSYRDIQAALAAGAQPLLVKTGKGEQTLREHPDFNFPIFATLYDAVQHLLAP
jgi:D-glycero-D-manno-heptose 1,7-bisphosphate phosphatase